MPVKLPYGLRNGTLVHISEVDSGMACACVHPVSGVPLQAHKGRKKRHHFHAAASGKSDSFESFVHLLAKQLLENGGTITVPEATVHIQTDTSGWTRDLVVGRAQEVEIANVRTERRIPGSSFVCDNVGDAQWGPLVIEWKNTHGSEPGKKAFLVESKIRSIEVDVSGWEERGSKGDLERWILHEAPRTWIYDSRLDTPQLERRGLKVERKPCYRATRFFEENGKVRPHDEFWVKGCPVLDEIVSTRKCRCCPFLGTLEYYASAYVDCFGKSDGPARRWLLDKGSFAFTWPGPEGSDHSLFLPLRDGRRPRFGDGFKRGWDAPRNDLPPELERELEETPKLSYVEEFDEDET